MPCRYDVPTPQEIQSDWEAKFLHNSTLAEIFCSVMLKLEDMDKGFSDPFVSKLPTKAQKWWKEHKERDRKRVNEERKEMERQQAFTTAYNKLTPGERKLLGVKDRQD